VALVLIVGIPAGIRPGPASCKPTPPIELEASIVGDPSLPFGITARASSRTGVPVDLEIVLPDGVVAVAGRTRAFGPRCEARLDVRAADRTRREILVRATFTQGGATMTRVLPLVIFDGTAPAAPGTLRKNSRGEPILEFSP